MEQYTDEQLELITLADECTDEAVVRLYEGKLKDAEEMALRAQNIYEEVGNRRKNALAMNLLSIIYDEMGNGALDLEYMLDALEIALDDEMYDTIAKLYNNIGSKLIDVKGYDRAIHYFTRSVEYLEKVEGDKSEKIPDFKCFQLVLNLNMSSVYCRLGDYDKARKYYELAKVISKDPETEELKLTFEAYEGLVLWKLGEKEQARELAENIIKTAQETDYITDYMEVMQDLLELLKEMKDYENWEKVLTIMDSRLQKDVGLFIKLEVMKHWLDFYKTSGNDEMYRAKCVEFYELSMEKSVQDYENSAKNIELNAEMRRAKRQKKATDAIVYKDALTGIGNRSAMLKDSKEYIANSAKNRTAITIGLIDIDFFKECNDTYGHITGDECLVMVAETITSVVGNRGKVYRYGGDEFLLLVENQTSDELLEMGQQIKDEIAKKAMKNEKSPISEYVTVSQGYTKAIADDGDSIEVLINLADKVLYTVKRRGRDNFKYTHYDDILSGIETGKNLC